MSDSKYAHFVRIFAVRGQFVLGKQNGRNSHLWFYGTELIKFRLTFLDVNCAFGFVGDCAIATKL